MYKVWAVLIIAFCGGAAFGAEIPEFPNNWVNGGSVDNASLKGKVVLLYFFDTDCPRCRANWPNVDTLLKSFEDKPVVCVAINSGNPKALVGAYAKAVKTALPVFVDSDRQVEQKFGFTISLSNIYQWRTFDPDGNLVSQMPPTKESIDGLLPKAKWRVDLNPAPPALKAAWSDIEFGRYASATPVVRQALNAADPEVKKGAQTLDAALKSIVTERMSAANGAKDAKKNWDAYKLFNSVVTDFPGYPEAAKADSAARALTSDARVTKELKAAQVLETAQKLLNDTNVQHQQEGKTLLKAIATDAADTDAAAKANALLTPPPKAP